MTVQLLQFATYISAIAEGTFVVDIFSIPGSTLYVNSFLAVLNTRRHLRSALHLHSDVELAVSASAGSGVVPTNPQGGSARRTEDGDGDRDGRDGRDGDGGGSCR